MKLSNNKQLIRIESKKMSFKFRSKGLNRVRLFDVSRKIIPEKGGSTGQQVRSNVNRESMKGS